MATVTESPPSTLPVSPASTSQEPEQANSSAERQATSRPQSTILMPTLSLYRMSYDLYEQIAEAGLLGPKDRVVLLDGFLVNQMPIGSFHTASVALGGLALQAAAPAGWYVRSEQPIILRNGPDGDSAPQPDLVVAIGTILSYLKRHPVAGEVGLVVEVAADSRALRIDRAALPRYAHAGIPIACIVNIPDRSLEVYTEPSGPSADPGYRRFETLRPGQTLAGEIGNAETGPSALLPIPVEAFFAPE